MTLHLKSLFQQLHPLFASSSSTTPLKSKTDPSSSSKTTSKKAKQNSTPNKNEPKSDSKARKSLKYASVEASKLDQINCKLCLHRLNQTNEIKHKLKQAHINYIKSNLNENFFANIPMLIVRSFRPSINSANKIQVKKGSAVNALFMIDSKWIYVKTSSELKGFIPRKCCETFHYASKTTCTHLNANKLAKEVDHTYMTIDNLNMNAYKSSLNRICEQSKAKNRKLSIALNEAGLNAVLNCGMKLEKELDVDACKTGTRQRKDEENYENLIEFKSDDAQQQDEYELLQNLNSNSNNNSNNNNNNRDESLVYISPYETNSITNISPLNTNMKNEYDLLMTYSNCLTSKKQSSNTYYNMNSSENEYNNLSSSILRSKRRRSLRKRLIQTSSNSSSTSSKLAKHRAIKQQAQYENMLNFHSAGCTSSSSMGSAESDIYL